MALKSEPLDLLYASYMKNHPFGTALYTPQPYSRFHPGSVGYFDSNGSWNPITDLSSSNHSPTTGYKPVAEELERAPSEKSLQWGPKASSNTKAQKVALEAGVSAAAAAALPVDLGAYYRFTSEAEGGAILLTRAPVRHEKYYHESPFKDWIRENAGQLLEKRKEILDYGLWIVTSTWSTEECAINVWKRAGSGVGVGFKSSVVGLGELAPSGDWHEDGQAGGWVKVKADKDDEGRVVFFGGLRFAYRRITLGLKLKSDKQPRSYRSGAESAGSLETVTETPIPAGVPAQDGELFAVDCESVLETVPAKASGAGGDGADDEW